MTAEHTADADVTATWPDDLIDFYALEDRERQVEHMDVWLPVEFMAALRRWADREGVSTELHVARMLCEAINHADFKHASAGKSILDMSPDEFRAMAQEANHNG